jgi:hypothetical protein
MSLKLESDWIPYATQKERNNRGNIFLVNESTISHMINNMFGNKNTIFISNGMNHVIKVLNDV